MCVVVWTCGEGWGQEGVKSLVAWREDYRRLKTVGKTYNDAECLRVVSRFTGESAAS